GLDPGSSTHQRSRSFLSARKTPPPPSPRATKKARRSEPFFSPIKLQSTLAGLHALVGFVDDIDAATTANQLVVPVTGHERLERVADFHFYPRAIKDRRGSRHRETIARNIRAKALPVNATPCARQQIFNPRSQLRARVLAASGSATM